MMFAEQNKSGSMPGKIGTSLFLMIFALFGIFFMGFTGRALYQEISAQAWVETPCRIESGEIIKPQHSDDKHSYKVKYSYVYNGRDYSSTKLSLNSTGGEYAKILKLSRDYPPDKNAKCYVNPSNPSEAVLVRKIEWSMLPFMLIPLIFVAVGFGGIYFTWKKKKENVVSGGAAAIPDTFKSPAKQRYAMCAFFGIFLLVGILVGYFMFLKPIMKMQLAANWPQVSCEVESSRVASHSGKSTTYSIEVIFRYQYKGVGYTGDKYNFFGGSSSGYDSKAKVVRDYPSGKKTFCYVNPENPAEAVLSRDPNSDLWFGLIPAVFALVGLGGIIGSLKYGKKTKAHIYEQPVRREDNREYASNGGSVMQPVSTPGKTLFGTIIFALFWNGIVSVFVFQAVKSWRTDNVEWVLSIFIIPFVLVGMLMIFMVFYTLLQIFNPRPALKLDPASPALGERVSLSWEIPGYRSIKRLEIKLEGYEEVKYRSKNSDSDSIGICVFEQLSIVDINDQREITAGNIEFTIPRDTMHSFDADNNKIIWLLKLHGRRNLFPDLKYEYYVKIMPEKV